METAAVIYHLALIDAVQIVAAETEKVTCFIFMENGFSGVEETVLHAAGEVS